MENLWEIVSGAPWWVYVLLVYLVIIGIKSTKSHAVPIKRMILMPLLFTIWPFYNLYTRLVLGYPSLALVWIVFLALGAYLGFMEVRGWKISKDRRKGEITIPGNYSTLVLILLVFILKFFWGYFYATHSEISYRSCFWNILTSSLVSGFFIGRAWIFFKRYRSKS